MFIFICLPSSVQCGTLGEANCSGQPPNGAAICRGAVSGVCGELTVVTTGVVHCACRLLWGQAGQSNALAIAEGLGFSRQVVDAARKARDRTHSPLPRPHELHGPCV